MSWYKDHREIWKQIIETVAAEEHRTTQMVEKDTIQSMFLLGLSKGDIPFVFKGGTSLSKVYGLIDRFSEDIDLSLNRKPTEAEKRKTKIIVTGIADELGLVLSNPEAVHSKHSYNKYVFQYDSLFNPMPLELIIETSFYQAVYPLETREVHSFVGRFCGKRGTTLPIPFDASIVKMPVQSLERTFIDKVFAVCDYRIQNMQDRDSRHLYDIAKLLPHVKLDDELKSLIDAVRSDRMQSKNNPSAQPEYKIPQMLKEIIRNRFYEPDYNSITKRLLYEDYSYDEAIKNGIEIVSEWDAFEYRETGSGGCAQSVRG